MRDALGKFATDVLPLTVRALTRCSADAHAQAGDLSRDAAPRKGRRLHFLRTRSATGPLRS